LSRKERPHRPTLPHLDAPRGPPRCRRQDASHRLLQPTFPTRAPNLDRSTPKPAAFNSRGDRLPSAHPKAFFAKDPEHLGEHGVGPPFGNPAPGEAALDGAATASAQSLTFLPHVMEEKLGPARRRGHLGPAFSAALETEDQTSDAPVAPTGPLVRPGYSRRAEDRFHRPCVNKSGFPGLERLSSTRASPTFAGVTRHRSRSFAAEVRLPALVHPSDALARKG